MYGSRKSKSCVFNGNKILMAVFINFLHFPSNFFFLFQCWLLHLEVLVVVVNLVDLYAVGIDPVVWWGKT